MDAISQCEQVNISLILYFQFILFRNFGIETFLFFFLRAVRQGAGGPGEKRAVEAVLQVGAVQIWTKPIYFIYWQTFANRLLSKTVDYGS